MSSLMSAVREIGTRIVVDVEVRSRGGSVGGSGLGFGFSAEQFPKRGRPSRAGKSPDRTLTVVLARGLADLPAAPTCLVRARSAVSNLRGEAVEKRKMLKKFVDGKSRTQISEWDIFLEIKSGVQKKYCKFFNKVLKKRH